MEPEIEPTLPEAPPTEAATELSLSPDVLAGTVEAPETRGLGWVFSGDEGLRAGWSVLIFAALLALFSSVVGFAFLAMHLVDQKGHLTASATLFGELIPFLAMLGAAALVALIERRKNLLAFNLTGPRRGAHLLSGLLWTEWAFIGLFCIISCLCMNEYFRLMAKIDSAAFWPNWLKNSMSLISILLIGLFSLKPNQATDDLIWNIGRLLPGVPAIILLVSALSKKSSFTAWLQSLGGLLYITIPVILLIQMRMQGIVLPLAMIIMIWSNDTMAYLMGSFFGKHTLSPISPKKTWEGTIGGALITIVAATVFGYFSHLFRLSDWIIIALITTVAGTFGDLLESKLKRMAEVKDSGNIMPGHGGALDRFDSLLIATPFVFLYVNYFMR